MWPFSRPVLADAVEGADEIPPCNRCLRCVRACPTGALRYRDRMWKLDLSLCTFCGSCSEVCPNMLIKPPSRM